MEVTDAPRRPDRGTPRPEESPRSSRGLSLGGQGRGDPSGYFFLFLTAFFAFAAGLPAGAIFEGFPSDATSAK